MFAYLSGLWIDAWADCLSNVCETLFYWER